MESFLNIDLMVTFRGPAEALRAEEAGLFVLWIAPDDDEPTRWLACLELAGEVDGADPVSATFAALLAASATLRGSPGIVVHAVVHDIGFRRPGAPAGAPQPRRWGLSDGPPPTASVREAGDGAEFLTNAFAGLEETLPAALVAQATALGDRIAFSVYAEEP